MTTETAAKPQTITEYNFFVQQEDGSWKLSEDSVRAQGPKAAVRKALATLGPAAGDKFTIGLVPARSWSPETFEIELELKAKSV